MDAERPDQPIDEEILAEAGTWLVVLSSDAATDAERQEFAAWRDADPVHAAALRRIAVAAAVGQRGDSAALLGTIERQVRVETRPRLSHREVPAPRAFRRAPLAIAASLLLALAGAVTWTMLQDQLLGRHYRTGIGETTTVPLEDGSNVTLNSLSHVAVRYTGSRRSLVLLEGEALFDVMPDQRRPFRVRAGSRVVVAVGTAFDIDRRGEWVGVAVSKGTVAIQPDDRMPFIGTVRDEAALLVTQGQGTTYEGDASLRPVRAVPAEMIGSWRHRQLMYSNVPLSVVLDALGRHYGEKFEADRAAANQPITVLLRLGDKAATAQALATIAGLTVANADGVIRFTRTVPPRG